VSWIRGFSGQAGGGSAIRNVEDAPRPMRQELVDLFFTIGEHNPDEIPPTFIVPRLKASASTRPVSHIVVSDMRPDATSEMLIGPECMT
jgi:hypothetical protein